MTFARATNMQLCPRTAGERRMRQLGRTARKTARVTGCAAALLLALTPALTPAWAQKNSGPLLPLDPPRPAVRPGPPASPVTPGFGNPGYGTPGFGNPGPTNPDAERLAQTLPLDPQTRGLQDQEPANPQAVERRLGLREPHGPVTDLRGRTPTPRDIVNALAPR